MEVKVRKEVLRLVPYGIYAVTCGTGDQVTAFTATWLTQISFDPPLLALATRADSVACERIRSGGGFVVNFVGADQMPLLKELVKPAARRAEVAGPPSCVGPPVLGSAVAWAACRVCSETMPGDHVVFVAEVVDVGRPTPETPLVLSDTAWNYGG